MQETVQLVPLKSLSIVGFVLLLTNDHLSAYVITVRCQLPQVSENVVVNGYQTLSLNGSTFTVSCRTSHALIGARNYTCRDNGEWSPDPRTVQCIGDWLNPFFLTE